MRYMEVECPICLETIEVENAEIGEEIMCSVCGTVLEIRECCEMWILWEIERDYD